MLVQHTCPFLIILVFLVYFKLKTDILKEKSSGKELKDMRKKHAKNLMSNVYEVYIFCLKWVPALENVLQTCLSPEKIQISRQSDQNLHCTVWIAKDTKCFLWTMKMLISMRRCAG